MPNLPCENGGGSLNNPNNVPNNAATLVPYVAPTLPIGAWQITGLSQAQCKINEQLNQATYVAETLNISGAPINIYPLLGVHQQGNGSVLSAGRLIGSQPFPGHPLNGINGATPWWSLQLGANVPGSAYVGVDFGIKLLQIGGSEYEPQKQKWTNVGAISITQSNNPGYFAQQVRVDLTDGEVTPGLVTLNGATSGLLTSLSVGDDATMGNVTLMALSATTFNCFASLPDGTTIGLGVATINVPFFSTFLNFTITPGTVTFVGGDTFTITLNYTWKRVGIFNLIQSPSPQLLNLNQVYKVKAIRVTPTLFTGANSWEVLALDVLDAPPTDINNIQDLFFNENRDRSYGVAPILLKAQYSPADSANDLSKFGLNILDQYVFTVAFVTMVQALGRPIVIGDIIEVIPELQYDQNLLPVRKFLEVTDAGWSSAGFGPQYNPTVYRFSAQQALPSQETRDIFGTLDTQKYMIADSLFNNGVSPILNTEPLTTMEELAKEVADRVPMIGSDDERSVPGVPTPLAEPAVNPKGQLPASTTVSKPNVYIAAGLPPDGQPYGEGYTLPVIPGPADGEYFRLYYAPETKIAPRLHRFSLIKNRWIFIEQDKRGEYSSQRPSMRELIGSTTSQPLSKKQT